MQDLADLIRSVPDFPRAGVMFRDVSPLLASPDGFARCIAALAEPWQSNRMPLGSIFGLCS